MGHRGRETLVRCEKCGRQVRRDKAVSIEKPIFTNPLERKDVYSETYNRVLTREVTYCISCGKHGRIFQKKAEQLQREKARQQSDRFRGVRPNYGYKPSKPAQPAIQTQQPAASEKAESSSESGEGQPA